MNNTENILNEKKLNNRINQLRFLQKISSLSNVCYNNPDLFLKEVVILLSHLFGNDIKTKAIIKFKNKRFTSANSGCFSRVIKKPIIVRDKMQGYLILMVGINSKIYFNKKFRREIELLPTIMATINNFLERESVCEINQLLLNIANIISVNDNINNLINIIKNELGKIIDATNFCIALYDKEKDKIFTPYFYDEKYNVKILPKDSLTAYIIYQGKAMLINKDIKENLNKDYNIKNFGLDSKILLGVPLKLNSEVIGAIVFQNYLNENAYNEKDLEIIESLSAQLALIINKQKTIDLLNKTKRKAEESDKLKTEFINNLSHEIRTPLNGLIGFSNLLKNEELDSVQKTKYLNIIENSSHQIINIVDNLILISKINSNQLELIESEINLAVFFDQIYKKHINQFNKKQLALIIDINKEIRDFTIKVDKDKLITIINYFIDNSIKFTENGFVKIAVNIDNNELIISLQDTGIGIHKKDFDTIFLPFRQLETSDTRKYGGNGLGLAITKGLIKFLSGKINLQSEYGKGSIFSFKIPIKLRTKPLKKDTVLQSV